MNNIIKIKDCPWLPNEFKYYIDRTAESQLIQVLCRCDSKNINIPDHADWTDTEFKSFMHMTVKGFLNADLYTTLTEFMGRAEGSFGIQVAKILFSNLFCFLIACML